MALKRLVDLRVEGYASVSFRAEALFEVVDALVMCPVIRSAVEVSQSPIFRRRFASVDDALDNGKIDPAVLRQALVQAEPKEALTVAGYAVYVIDTIIAARPDAKTVPDRAKVYSAACDKAIPGHQFSWLSRMVVAGQSWFAPREVVRVPTPRTPNAVGADQGQRLVADAHPSPPTAVVGDSHDAQPTFLRAFVGQGAKLAALVRLASNRVLYGPASPPTGKRGRPPHLGHLDAIETWVHVVMIAYSQLLLARHLVQPTYRPWGPTARQDPNRPLTPGQVLDARSATGLSATASRAGCPLGPPAQAKYSKAKAAA